MDYHIFSIELLINLQRNKCWVVVVAITSNKELHGCFNTNNCHFRYS